MIKVTMVHSLSPSRPLAVTVTRNCVGIWNLRLGKLMCKLADSPLGAIVTQAGITRESRCGPILPCLFISLYGFVLVSIYFCLIYLLTCLSICLITYFFQQERKVKVKHMYRQNHRNATPAKKKKEKKINT